ncbi:29034_t:CDS:2, partial [Gigaspora margarita]
FYKEFGWENGDSTPFDKVDEQNNENSTLEQSTELLVRKEVKTSTPNSEYKNCSNDFQQTLDPLKINFTQTTIRGYNGYNIEETTKDLISADSKRLYCLKKATKNEAKFNKVPVKIAKETDEKDGVKWKMNGSLIVIPNTNWSNVIVSDYAML